MNLLFIPHVPNLNVINRVYEFSKNTNSYFLNWKIDNTSLGAKVLSQLQSLRYSIDETNKIIQIPLLFKPEGIASTFNTVMLNRLIEKLNIDVVVNANALLFDVKKIAVPVIYDLVDDHLSPNADIGLTYQRIAKIKEDIAASRGVVCVTHVLEEKVKALGLHSNTVTIENGLYLERFTHAKSLKQALNLEGKRVFGYIGGVSKWTGIDRAIKAYLKIKDDTNAFLVVGGDASDFYTKLVRKYGKDVLFVGSVAPSKVADYFKTIDVGLVPFELNAFTHNALPIKAMEYALAGACVIATPLNGLKAKNFPFVTFCDIEAFAVCMQKKCDEVTFDFDKYSWKEQSSLLYRYIEESL